MDLHLLSMVCNYIFCTHFSLKNDVLQQWQSGFSSIMFTVNNFSVPVMYYMILENKNLF